MTNDLNIFFKEVFTELKKIIWPSKREFFVALTGTLCIVFIFALYLGFVDVVIGIAVTKIIYAFL
jgi:preprotein translocase SecE subunit